MVHWFDIFNNIVQTEKLKLQMDSPSFKSGLFSYSDQFESHLTFYNGWKFATVILMSFESDQTNSKLAQILHTPYLNDEQQIFKLWIG